MPVYALFKDGSASEIIWEDFRRDWQPGELPISPHLLTAHNRKVEVSCESGCFAAFHNLCRTGYLASDEHYCFSLQFAGNDININAQGFSAGLAFCLKFAQEIYDKKYPPLPFSVAATGEISNASENARVEAVEGINQKLRAAIAVLKRGDRVFYPEGNHQEVDATLVAEAQQKGVDLIGVATAGEAIGRFLPPRPPATAAVPRRYPILVALATVAFLATALISLRHYYFPDAPRLKATLHYRGTNMVSLTDVEASQASAILYSGDRYWLEISADEACFLYMYQVDACNQLYPLVQAQLLRPEEQHLVPAQEGRPGWFELDSCVGRETLYLVALQEKDEDLKEISRRFGMASPQERGRLRSDLSRRIEQIGKSERDALVHVSTFQHDSPR